MLAEQTLAALPPPEVAPAARGLVRQLADPAGAAAPFALEVLAGDAYCDAVRTSLAGFLAALWERLGPAGAEEASFFSHHLASYRQGYENYFCSAPGS